MQICVGVLFHNCIVSYFSYSPHLLIRLFCLLLFNYLHQHLLRFNFLHQHLLHTRVVPISPGMPYCCEHMNGHAKGEPPIVLWAVVCVPAVAAVPAPYVVPHTRYVGTPDWELLSGGAGQQSWHRTRFSVLCHMCRM